MAGVPTGGVKKKLTLQTKKRFQISSPSIGKFSNNSGQSSRFTGCNNTLRKELFSLCMPTSSLIPPLPTSKVQCVEDVRVERTCVSSLPSPRFEVLTRQSLSPLDLKKCQTDSVDEQIVELETTSNKVISRSSVHAMGVVDTKRQGIPITRYIPLVVQNKVGVAAATKYSSEAIQAQQNKVKSNNIHGSHHTSKHFVKGGGNIFSHKLSQFSTRQGGPGQVDGDRELARPQQLNSRKRTWNEVSDDEEFDELCKSVDLSFTTEQVTVADTPNNSLDNSQKVVNVSDLAIGTWTCPMCGEHFFGRSAAECEQHLALCVAMDIE